MMPKKPGEKSERRLPIAMRGCLRAMMPALLTALLLAAGAAVSPRSALAQTRTTVADTIHAPDGSLPSGQIVISANSTFTAADGSVVLRGTVATVTVANGSFSVALIPNAGSTPAGTSYSAIYKLAGVPYRNETWVVPSSSSPVTLADVRSAMLSGPSEMLSSSQMPPSFTSTVTDKGGQVFNVKAYGLVGDGTTDNTAAFNSLLQTVSSDGGGTIYFPAGKWLFSGQITLPNDGTAVNASVPYSRQPYIRIKGAGSVENGQGQVPNTTYGGSVLEMTYSGSNAKVITLGLGKLEIDHLTMWDPNGDSTPFILTTGTTLSIHNDAFIGAKGLQTADQDALILGGKNTTFSAVNDPSYPFQGYDTIIRNNYFNYIRRALVAQTWAAHVSFDHNFIGPECGSNLADGAAVLFDGTPLNANTVDNDVVGNRCEITGYNYCFKFLGSQSNYIAGNDVEDALESYNDGIVYLDANSSNNLILLNAAPTSGGITLATHVVDLTGGENVVLDSSNGATTKFSQLQTLKFNIDNSADGTGVTDTLANGDVASYYVYPTSVHWDYTPSGGARFDLFGADTNSSSIMHFHVYGTTYSFFDGMGSGFTVFKADSGDAYLGTAFDQYALKASGTDGSVQVDKWERLTPHAFSTYPACSAGTEGDLAAISDSTVNTWGSTIAGGGSNHVLGYCDGTGWTVAAK